MNDEREPVWRTDPALAGVLEELMAREPIFHRPELGTSRVDFERMTARDFWEVGASGRLYSREFVLATLEERYAGAGEDNPGHNPGHNSGSDAWEASGFACRKLAEDVYLLTYTLIHKGRRTRRSTLWQRMEEGWKIVFHQGTVVADE